MLLGWLTHTGRERSYRTCTVSYQFLSYLNFCHIVVQYQTTDFKYDTDDNLKSHWIDITWSPLYSTVTPFFP